MLFNGSLILSIVIFQPKMATSSNVVEMDQDMAQVIERLVQKVMSLSLSGSLCEERTASVTHYPK